jgi:hypothetical protein
MATITNDEQFRKLASGLDDTQQRRLAARFVQHVLSLCSDERVTRVTQVAGKDEVSADELASALHTARTAAIESHNRCGAECDWKDQAGYFVARAAVAAVSPANQIPGGPAWQAAVSSRMARTCESIDAAADNTGTEQDYQYRTLAEFLGPR